MAPSSDRRRAAARRRIFLVLAFAAWLGPGAALAQQEGDLRLLGGANPWEGRLEIYHQGSGWGTICDDGVTGASALVACRQLAFATDAPTLCSEAGGGAGSCYAQVAEPILIENLACDGSEARLADCAHSAWGSHD